MRFHTFAVLSSWTKIKLTVGQGVGRQETGDRIHAKIQIINLREALD